MDLSPNWHGGWLLAFSGLDGQTDFNHGLVARTAFAPCSLELKWPLPPGQNTNFRAGKICFSESAPLWSQAGSDFFQVMTDRGLVRAVMLNAYHLLLEGKLEVTLEADTRLQVVTDGNRTLVGVNGFFQPELIRSDLDALIEQRGNWAASQPMPEGAGSITRKAMRRAYAQMKGQFNSPEGIIKHRWTTPDRWPHRKMWLWDSVFHAIGLRHLNPALAREAIDAVLDTQREDGFIAHMMDPKVISAITQPPVLALGVSLVNQSEDRPEWLAAVYPKLKAYLEWDMKNRDSDGFGLLEWFIEEHVDCRSGESGMDNSPRFDCANQLDATDFNAFLALEFELMGQFAARCRPADQPLWQERHAAICRRINERLWNEEQGFYVDYDLKLDRQSPILASSGFLPLICGAASTEQAARLAAHLSNPDTFNTALPVPSIAVNCPENYSKDMWRGPVWINLNWLIAMGLRRYGYQAEADTLLHRTTAEIERYFLAYGTFFEFYDDRMEIEPPKLLRKKKNIPDTFHQAFFDYGWSATLYVDMIFSQKHQ